MSQNRKQPDIDALIQAISEREGIQFEPGQRLAGGEQGAWVIADPSGTRYILKPESIAFITLCLRGTNSKDLSR
jgi:hypothetical protein